MVEMVEIWQNLEKNASQIMIFLPHFKNVGSENTKYKDTYIFIQPFFGGNQKQMTIHDHQAFEPNIPYHSVRNKLSVNKRCHV